MTDLLSHPVTLGSHIYSHTPSSHDRFAVTSCHVRLAHLVTPHLHMTDLLSHQAHTSTVTPHLHMTDLLSHQAHTSTVTPHLHMTDLLSHPVTLSSHDYCHIPSPSDKYCRILSCDPSMTFISTSCHAILTWHGFTVASFNAILTRQTSAIISCHVILTWHRLSLSHPLSHHPNMTDSLCSKQIFCHIINIFLLAPNKIMHKHTASHRISSG